MMTDITKVFFDEDKENFNYGFAKMSKLIQTPEVIQLAIEKNILGYEKCYREHSLRGMIGRRIIHRHYMQRARELGVDVSIFPEELEELNLERQN